MQTPNQMKQDLGGMNPVQTSMDVQPGQKPDALSMALKQRRLAKAAKRRIIETNSPMDNPTAIENPRPEEF